MSDTSGHFAAAAAAPSRPDPNLAPLLGAVLDQLACPGCFADLHLEGSSLMCRGCGRVYPIVDGSPVLIAESAHGDSK
jgi:uncharacterized protein